MNYLFQHKRVKIIFLIYLLFIVDVVVIKYYGNVEDVMNRIQAIIAARNNGIWNINLNPLISIASFLRSFQYGGIRVIIFFIGNIFVFVPLGFSPPLVMKNSSFLKTMALCLLIIIGIELTQFAACLGYADLGDVILNMIGSLIGFIVYKLYYIFAKKKPKTQNRTGAIH